MQSWIPVPPDSDFTIHNLPFGIFTAVGRRAPRIGVAIGDDIFDVKRASDMGLLHDVKIPRTALVAENLNALIAEGRPAWRRLRATLQRLFQLNQITFAEHQTVKKCLIKQKNATMHLPISIGDYTDFYSSEAHATNVGKMFRDPANALLPNWKHLPVAYHGRASSIRVSGTDFHRPKGQVRPNDAEPPQFSPTRSLDFELEMAFIVGKNSDGEPISTAAAAEHIFGFVIFNDWSARDIQRWEYVPLGPFLAKNFFSSMSAWVVTLDALEPFRVEGVKQDPEPMDYLKFEGKEYFDVQLQVDIVTDKNVKTRVSNSNFKHLYWNAAQQLAHHSINGCPMRVGDVLASGTISGEEPTSFGSMLELTWGGKQPIALNDGTERKFIQDGDTVVMSAYAERDGIRVGFGSVKNKVLPTK